VTGCPRALAGGDLQCGRPSTACIRRSWLDFHDALVELDPAEGTFTARLAPVRVEAAAATVADVPRVLTGRFAVDAELVRTAAVLLPR
jgi:hypothetical protein